MEIGKEYEVNLNDYLNGKDPEEVKKDYDSLSDEEREKLEMKCLVDGAMAMLDIQILKVKLHARIDAIDKTIKIMTEKGEMDDVKMSFLAGQIAEIFDVLTVIDPELAEQLEKESEGIPFLSLVMKFAKGRDME